MSEETSRSLATLLRRLRLFERRWIPEREERERHAKLVRDRLRRRRPAPAEGNDPA